MSFASGTAAFGLKSSTTNNNASTSAPVFGQTNAQGNTQPQSTGFGIFGNPAQNQPSTQGSALFGNSAFGQNNQNHGQTAQQPASTGTGVFGQSSTIGQQNQQQQPQQSAFSSSLFGGSTNANQPAQNPFNSFNAFGSVSGNNSNAQPSQQQQPALSTTGTGGWLSSAATNPLQAQPTLPSISTNNNAFGLNSTSAGSSLFGQQKQQTMGMSQMQPSGQPLFSKSTKFNDLPDEVKRVFETIDSHIQGRVQISTELKQRKLGDEATKGQELIRDVHKELLNVSSIIQSDATFTRDLKTKTEQAVQDTIVAIRIVDGFRNPQQSGAYLKNHASFPFEFFSRITQEMKERLQWYKKTIEQIERKLSSIANQTQSTPQAITATLQAQHATFISLAAKTAAVDAELQKVKTLYTQLWRAKTGSMRDPFNDLDKTSDNNLTINSLRV